MVDHLDNNEEALKNNFDLFLLGYKGRGEITYIRVFVHSAGTKDYRVRLPPY